MMNLIIIGVLLVLGYTIGRATEKNHYKSIVKREAQYRKIAVISGAWKNQIAENQEGQVFGAGVVIGADYFKSFIAGLRALLGGRMRNYESLLDRGRREAALRVLEKADNWGADKIINFRFETAVIGGMQQGDKGLPCVEIYAYGTALRTKKVNAVQA